MNAKMYFRSHQNQNCISTTIYQVFNIIFARIGLFIYVLCLFLDNLELFSTNEILTDQLDVGESTSIQEQTINKQMNLPNNLFVVIPANQRAIPTLPTIVIDKPPLSVDVSQLPKRLNKKCISSSDIPVIELSDSEESTDENTSFICPNADTVFEHEDCGLYIVKTNSCHRNEEHNHSSDDEVQFVGSVQKRNVFILLNDKNEPAPNVPTIVISNKDLESGNLVAGESQSTSETVSTSAHENGTIPFSFEIRLPKNSEFLADQSQVGASSSSQLFQEKPDSSSKSELSTMDSSVKQYPSSNSKVNKRTMVKKLRPVRAKPKTLIGIRKSKRLLSTRIKRKR